MATQPAEKILAVSKTVLVNARSCCDFLSRFGVTAATLDAFEQDIATAEALPSDEAQRIELSIMTKRKDDVLNDTYEWGRDAKIRLELALGRSSPEFKAFPAKTLLEAYDNENAMMSVMEIIIKMTKQHHDILELFGQTPEIRDKGPVLLEALRQVDAAQEAHQDANRAATQERNIIFQKLYDAVNRINKIGRVVFQDDPSRRVLFDSKW